MARAMKKEDAIALAGKAAAQAAYSVIEKSEETKEESQDETKEKDPPKALTHDEEEQEQPQREERTEALADGFRARRGIGLGRPTLSTPIPGAGYRPRSFSGFGSSNDGESEGDEEASMDAQRVLDSIPQHERATVIFKFRARRTSPNGRTNFVPVGDFTVAGKWSDAEASIKEKLARIGPGDYDGVPYTSSGKLIKGGHHWAFEIQEEEARAAGWQPERKEESVTTAVPVLAAPTAHGYGDQEDDVAKAAKREKDRIDLLKYKVETTKLEMELDQMKQQGNASSKQPEAVKESALNSETIAKLLAAEKATLEAEHRVALARAEAAKERELAKIQAEAEKDKRAVEADREKAENALRELRNDISRKETEHLNTISTLKRELTDTSAKLAGDFERQISGLKETFGRERDQKPQRSPEETAVVFAQVIGAALKPLADLAIAKFNQPAPAPADPTKQFADMTKAMAPLLDKLAPQQQAPAPQIDPMALMGQVTTMVKDMMPKEKGIRAEDIAEAVARGIEAKMPQQPVAPPQPAMDPFALVDRVTNMAKNMIEMNPVRAQHSRAEEDEDDEPEDRPGDFELAEKALDKFKRFGVNVQIGNAPPPAPPTPAAPKSVAEEIVGGVKSMLPEVGEIVTKYWASKPPQVDPDVLREAQILVQKKKNAARLGNQGGQQPQQRPQQRRPQPQAFQPQQPQPRPQPQAFQPQQPQSRPQHVAPQAQAPQQAQQRRAPQQVQQAPQRPQQRPQPIAPANKYAAQPQPYNLPVAHIPRRPDPVPGFIPQETVPQRPGVEQRRQQAVNSIPVETLPVAAPAQSVPAEAVPQRPAPQAVQRPAPQAQQPAPQAQQRQPAPLPQPQRQAVPVQTRRSQQPFQPQQRPIQQQRPIAPQRQAATPTQQVQRSVQTTAIQQAPAAQTQAPPKEVMNGVMPTAQTWGVVSSYVVDAMKRGEDPGVAAVYLLEHYPNVSKVVLNVAAEMGGVEAIDNALTNFATEAGPYADVIGELASKIRNDGKEWAERLILGLRGSL